MEELIFDEVIPKEKKTSEDQEEAEYEDYGEEDES